MAQTMITAHAGCEGTAPNSREHVLSALSVGCEMLEVDVRREGTRLYLSHNEARADDCLSLSEFLSMVRPSDQRINFDVKEDGLIEDIMAEALRRGMEDRVVFTGQANHRADLIRSLGGELWMSLWNSKDEAGDLRRMEDVCLSAGFPTVNCQYRIIHDEDAYRLVRRGIGVSVWTVDEEAEIARFLSLGVKNITTRRPKLALVLRKSIQGI